MGKAIRRARKSVAKTGSSKEEVAPPVLVPEQKSASVVKRGRKVCKNGARQSQEVQRADVVGESTRSQELTEAEPQGCRKKRKRTATAPSISVKTSQSSSKKGLKKSKRRLPGHGEQVRTTSSSPVQSFEAVETDFGPLLIAKMRAEGWMQPTPVQAQSWPLLLRGGDLVAVADTGTGKTAAYTMPAIARFSRKRRSDISPSPERKPIIASATLDKVSNSTKGGPPPGAWTCSFCNNVNWPQREKCNTRSCGAARPVNIGGDPVAAEKTVVADRRPAKPFVLILAPARELAQQIHDEVVKFADGESVRATCIYGGIPKGEQAETLMSRGADIVVATPGRCLDFLEKDKFLGQPLCVTRVTYLVLDEADRMLECGFLPEIQKIVDRCPPPNTSTEAASRACASNYHVDLRRQTLLFTATWPPAVQSAAKLLVGKTVTELQIGQRSLGGPTANKAVQQVTEIFQNHGSKLERLVELLRKDLLRGTCLVFCKTKDRCDWLVKRLSHELEDCPWIKAVHSGMKQQDREANMNSFREITASSLVSGKSRKTARTRRGEDKGGVLVATNVAGRGIDVPGVPLVIVYDFCTIDDYIHQVGRTGRAGASGRAVTFYVAGDGGAQNLVGVLTEASQVVPQALRDIASAEGGETQPKFGARDLDGIKSVKARQGLKNTKWSKQRAS